MSAAALRNAARRAIGDRALPRMQAGIVGEARRRLIHSGKPLSSRTGICNKIFLTSDEGRRARMGQIQKMKDELYNAFAETERKNTIFDSLISENHRLMECLSAQVSPKPNDSHWRSNRRGKTVGDFLRIAGIFFISRMVVNTLLGTEPARKGKFVDYTENKSELAIEPGCYYSVKMMVVDCFVTVLGFGILLIEHDAAYIIWLCLFVCTR